MTADGLTVDGTATLGAATTDIFFADSFNSAVRTPVSSGHFYIQTASGAKTLAQFEDNNNISFYEDTGTTAKFFWDASAERLGVGTTSPAGNLEINGGTSTATAGGSLIVRQRGDTNSDGIALTSSNSVSHRIWKDSNGKLNIGSSTNPSSFVQDKDGNVGIGTNLPASALEVVGRIATSGGSADIQSSLFGAGDGSESNPSIRNIGDSDTGFWFPASNTIGFSTAGSEAIRIDSSQNLLVGTTDTAVGAGDTNTGISLQASGRGFFSAASDYSGRFNRNTNDGDVVTFAKNGSTVGSIRTISGDSIGIGNGDAGLRFVSGTNRIQPVDMDNGLNSDGLTDLGDTNKRFQDLLPVRRCLP